MRSKGQTVGIGVSPAALAFLSPFVQKVAEDVEEKWRAEFALAIAANMTEAEAREWADLACGRVKP